MGKKQFLLIFLGIILIVATAFICRYMYQSYKIDAHQDDIIFDIMRIADAAYKYRVEQGQTQDGVALYTGFEIPQNYNFTSNALYQVSISDDGEVITIKGLSQLVVGASIYAHFDRQLNFLAATEEGERHILSPIGSDRESFFFWEGW
ncbi:MAG: hypothetical protein K0B81_07035 [Candidatus Cloacimonetes bacterium]|nr:hypothetical protein [Candidatus Cloacimonadota bacterium]